MILELKGGIVISGMLTLISVIPVTTIVVTIGETFVVVQGANVATSQVISELLKDREDAAASKAELRKVTEVSRKSAEKSRTHPFVNTDRNSRSSFYDYDQVQKEKLERINDALRKSDIPPMQRWEMTKASAEDQISAQQLKQASSKLGKPPKSEPKVWTAAERREAGLRKRQAEMRKKL